MAKSYQTPVVPLPTWPLCFSFFFLEGRNKCPTYGNMKYIQEFTYTPSLFFSDVVPVHQWERFGAVLSVTQLQSHVGIQLDPQPFYSFPILSFTLSKKKVFSPVTHSNSSLSPLTKIGWGQTWSMHIKLRTIVQTEKMCHFYNYIMCYIIICYDNLIIIIIIIMLK